MDASHSDPTPPRSPLSAAARRTAVRAAAQWEEGLALVFAASPGDPVSLRLAAAAGFETSEAALAAARLVHPEVLACVGAGSARSLPALRSLGARAAGGVSIQPLVSGGRIHGALAAAGPSAPGRERESSLSQLAADLAVHFDCAELTRRVEALGARLDEMEGTREEKSEEILKLSEALFAQDIELLKSQERLGKVEKLKNDFIEKMSRELRTPLNGIIEAIISVLTGEDDSLSDGAKSVLRSALDDGTAFLRTLQNILDLWRIKQGELPIEIHDVNIREVVEEAVFTVQDAIDEKSLVVEQRFEEPLPKVRTDLTKVSQILLLLLDNAVKFTPQGQIEISARVEGGQLSCHVRDTGIGICADDEQLIFDEFFQVDESGAEKARGSGLGLALVKDLVVLLDGTLSVNSRVGRGTTIGFEIPVQILA